MSNIDEIITALKANDPTVTTLNYKNKGEEPIIPTEKLPDLTEALAGNHTVTELIFFGADVNNPLAEAIAQALRINKTLTTLVLDTLDDTGFEDSVFIRPDKTNTGIDDDAVRKLAKVIESENRTLKVLSMPVNRIGNQGSMWLATALRSNSSIKKLDLTENYRMTAEGAGHFARALRERTSPIKLILNSNLINDGDLTALAELTMALSNNHKLRIQFEHPFLEDNYDTAAAIFIQRLIERGHTFYNPKGDEADIEAPFREFYALAYRNDEFANAEKNFHFIGKEIEKLLEQMNSSTTPTEIDSLCNKVQKKLENMNECLTLLDKYQYYTELKRIYDSLMITISVKTGNVEQAVALYAQTPSITPQAALSLAEAVYANFSCVLPENKTEETAHSQSFHPARIFPSPQQHVKVIFTLLQQAFMLEQAQKLIAHILNQLLNPDQGYSCELTCQEVLNVDKAIPLVFIQKTITDILETEKIDSATKQDWQRIDTHLDILSPTELYAACQLSPLKEALEDSLGTSKVTTFESIEESVTEGSNPSVDGIDMCLEDILTSITIKTQPTLKGLINHCVQQTKEENTASAQSAAASGIFSNRRKRPLDSDTDDADQPKIKRANTEASS